MHLGFPFYGAIKLFRSCSEPVMDLTQYAEVEKSGLNTDLRELSAFLNGCLF